MELKFGCQVEYQKSHAKATVIGYAEGVRFALYWERGTPRTIEVKDGDVFTILGRPIRLADVLLVGNGMLIHDIEIKGDFAYTFELDKFEHNLKPFWNLKDDNLDNQSDECKDFLINLLVNA